MKKKSLQPFYGSRRLLVFLSFMLLHSWVFSQDVKITGRVLASANGTPLANVTVKVKDKKTATTTNADGNFTISAPKGSSLQFSYVGYVINETPVGNQTNLEVKLDASEKGLDEVVVVGYGSKRKRDITSAGLYR